ncbi:hypothetical protein ABMC88_00075 [Sulfitobacter sp. HNIBRBA2951]|uniref:hypothetical protein n=1 Tax=Sulfitobacter aquimarinus TaxID=3158557 RepID=UPI0032DE3FB2
MASACVGGIHSSGMILSANAGKQALRAKNLTVTGAADLEGCSIFGTTDFTGAKITGDLSCKRATFNNKDGDAFIARRMQVAQSFIWRKDATATGKVILDGAHAAELDDNPQHWPDAAHLSLDGFTYDRIAEYTDYNPARKDWLHNGSHTDGKFFPQPYSQYAKFLRDTGHDSEARKVLLTRETLVRDHERSELNGFNLVKRTAGDWLQKVVVGYGHDPFRSIWWLFGLIFIATIPACFAWNEGSFAPNSGPVLVSQGWTNLHTEAPNPAKIWSGDMVPKGWTPEGVDTTDWDETQLADAWKNSAPGRDWETFNSVAYAADIVIPLINFGQTETWAPSTTRGWWGWHLWWMRWGFTVFGWIVTALGAAAITGIIRRE